MSASTQVAPRHMSFGRFPMALAIMTLIVIVAVAIAAVALNGTRAAAPATTGAKGAPPPAVIDHGWSSAVAYGQSVSSVPFYDHGWSKVNEPGQSVTNVPFYDHGSRDEMAGSAGRNGLGFGGWNGPRLAPVYAGDTLKDDQYIPSTPSHTGGAHRGLGSRAQ